MHYFHLLIPRLTLMLLLMILSISILSLFFSHKPWLVWILMLLIVFGSIINKTALFPIHAIQEFYIFFSFCLPPILEIIFSTATLDFSFWRVIFLCIAFIQITFYFILNIKFISLKDFLWCFYQFYNWTILITEIFFKGQKAIYIVR